MTTMERIAYRVKRKPGEGPRTCALLPPVPKAAMFVYWLKRPAAASAGRPISMFSPAGKRGGFCRGCHSPRGACRFLLKTEVTGAQLVHQLENPPTAACHAGERVIRHYDGETGLFREELVDIAQERATAGEHDTTLGDVRSKLRR